uniref:Uncharacterized protein n=1 Tax=Malurus cyaneus samueli TaxID=2593467 RepID=A0A8C5X1D3_9PASS
VFLISNFKFSLVLRAHLWCVGLLLSCAPSGCEVQEIRVVGHFLSKNLLSCSSGQIPPLTGCSNSALPSFVPSHGTEFSLKLMQDFTCQSQSSQSDCSWKH